MTKSILPATAKRVQLNTKEDLNQAIKKQTICNLNYYKNDDEAALSDYVKSLDKEWDTERVLEANAAAIILIGSMVGLKQSKAFLFTATISFFLLQHALQGWCPPLPFIRKLGIRTSDEINNEKIAIKMMRGDFAEMPDSVHEILHIAGK